MRVIVANDSAVEAVVALSDIGKYVSVDVQSMATSTAVAEADEDDEEDDARRAALSEHLRDRAAQPDSARR